MVEKGRENAMRLTRYIAVVAGVLPALAATAEPSLTKYNQQFAVARQPVALDLKAGINVYDGARINPRSYRSSQFGGAIQERDYGTQSNPKVWVMKEIKNSKENHLAIPLPRGRMRFYRQDDDGQLEFIGENTIDHTPRDETVRVRTGDAFDLVGERRRTDFQLDSARRGLTESFEIKLRNRKENGSVEIRVVEHLYRWSTWEIVEKSDPFTKTDSQTVEFRVPIPAGQEKTITYKVRYTW
jgi:hypothetical protein